MLYGITSSEYIRQPVTIEVGAIFSGSGLFTIDGTLIQAGIQQATASFSGAGQLLSSSTLILNPTVAFAGAGLATINAWLDYAYTAAFTQTLSGNDSGGANYSERIICASIAAGGSQVRVTFKASGAAGWNIDNASIGKQSSTYVTAATPVELLFNGAHGFALAAGGTITSDWTAFSSTTGDTLIVIFDNSSTNGNPGKTATLGNRYFLANTNSYNVASPGGSWINDDSRVGVLEIDVAR